MNRRRVTVAVAAAGVVAGATGLGVLAMPAGAGPAPVLPDVTAESLVESVITAEPAAFGGAVEVDNDLGVPALAGMPQLSDGASSLRMWTDGAGRVRVQLPAGESEKTFVDDGRTSWLWDSAEQTVQKVSHGGVAAHERVEGAPSDPVTLARDVVSRVQEFSDVTVDGTARVAGRAAYELVLTPKPTERTVLREVRVAVDAELRAPLRVSVLTNGTNAPAVQIGFSDLEVGPQDAALFAFTPPAGAEVTEVRPEDVTAEDRSAVDRALTEADPRVVGEGWDTVLVARVPADALANLDQRPSGEDGQDGENGEWEGRRERGVDVQGLLRQLGKQVSGPWGSGTLITARVGGVLIADDGRVAVGAVPEQVLTEAIGQVK